MNESEHFDNFSEAIDMIHCTIDRVAKERDISLSVNFWADGTVSFSVYPYGSVSSFGDAVCEDVFNSDKGRETT